MSTESSPNAIRQGAYRLILWQMLFVLLIALFSGFYWHGFRVGSAVFLGGLSGGVANLYFAWRFLRKMDSRAPHQIMRAMIVGELSKLALSVILVIVFIVVLPIPPLGVIGGFVAAQVGFWLAPQVDRIIKK